MKLQDDFGHQISIIDTAIYLDEIHRLLRVGFTAAERLRDSSFSLDANSLSFQSIIISSRILGDIALGIEELYPKTEPPLLDLRDSEKDLVAFDNATDLHKQVLEKVLVPVVGLLCKIEEMASPVSDLNLVAFVRKTMVGLDLCRNVLSGRNWMDATG